jgi:branched-chain amino acid transport system substrate-binding protein
VGEARRRRETARRRRSRLVRRLGVSVGLLLALTLRAGEAPVDDKPPPQLDLRTRLPEYLGPGRELGPLPGLSEIRLAFFGPAEPDHPDWGDAWRGASLAVEEANASAGDGELPTHLEEVWSENPWGSGIADLAKLAFTPSVLAILGGVDGTTTHLAEQVAVKACLPVVSPGGTDPSVNYTNVAWMFTLLPTDDRTAPVVVEALLGKTDERRWAAVTTSDRDAAVAWKAVRAVTTRRHAAAPVLDLAVPPAAPDYAPAAANLVQAAPESVLVLAGARDAARLVRALRGAGFEGLIVGGAPVGRRVFLEEAGPCAEGVRFPLLFDAKRPDAAPFVARYQERYGVFPDFLAAHAYDAARLLLAAVRRAGPNRALVRDALVELAPWSGVTGEVTWDLTGRNTRPVELGVWRGGEARSYGTP